MWSQDVVDPDFRVRLMSLVRENSERAMPTGDREVEGQGHQGGGTGGPGGELRIHRGLG